MCSHRWACQSRQGRIVLMTRHKPKSKLVFTAMYFSLDYLIWVWTIKDTDHSFIQSWLHQSHVKWTCPVLWRVPLIRQESLDCKKDSPRNKLTILKIASCQNVGNRICNLCLGTALAPSKSSLTLFDHKKPLSSWTPVRPENFNAYRLSVLIAIIVASSVWKGSIN